MIPELFNEWGGVISELKLASNNAAVAIYNSQGLLLYANNAMCSYLGISDITEKAPYFFVNPDFNQLVNAKPDNENRIFGGLLTIGNRVDISYVLKAQIFRKEDTICIYAEADSMLMFEENKNMSRLNQEVNNLQRQIIKEKRTLEQTLNELKETQQMLIHSEKMNALGQMVAGVAHEINNPISFVINNMHELRKYSNEIINAFSELEAGINTENNQEAISLFKRTKEKYEFEYLTEDIIAVISESQAGVERVKKIVEDLRRFSRLDESAIKHIDLIENMNSTLSIIKPEIDKKEIIFQFDAPNTLFVDCYPGQLNQALLNILINAVYAVEQKGKVYLRMKLQNNQLQIEIADNGCGIDNEIIGKIFNPFFTTKPVGAGTGLGLSITYKIITDLHKGSISVESEPNIGTTFKITIPILVM